MSDRMKRAFEKYNERVYAAASEERGERLVFEMTDADDDPSRHIVAGTDVSFDELAQQADRQADLAVAMIATGDDPFQIISGQFRAAFLGGVFFAQDGDS